MKKEDLKTGDNQSQQDMVKVDETMIRKYISTDRLLRPWSKDGKKGFVDIDGNWVIAPVYDDVDVFRESVAWVKTGVKWGLINYEGETLIAPKFEDAREFNDGLAAVKINGHWGIIDCADSIVIEAAYDNIWSVRREWVVVRKDGLYGYLNPANGNTIEPIYQTVREFSEGMAAVKLKGAWGFVDMNGNVAITPQFNYVSDYYNGKSVVVTPERMWGEIDLQGNPIVEAEEDDDVEDGVSQTKWFFYDEPQDERCYYGFVNREGETIVKMKYRDSTDFSNGMSMVLIDNKWGVIDKTGAYLVEPQFSMAEIKELIKRLVSTRCSHVEKKNNTLTCHPDSALMSRLREEYDFAYCDEDEGVIIIGFNAVKDNADDLPWDDSTYGLADYDGRIIVEPKYRLEKWSKHIFQISEGLAAVCVDGKYGYINTKGKMVIIPQFDEAKPFRNQRAVVKKNGFYGLIDTDGNFVLQPQYKKIFQERARIMSTKEYGDYYALVLNSEKYCDAIGHRDGRVVMLPRQFRMWYMDKDGMAVIQELTYKDGLFGYANCETGYIVVPCYNFTYPFSDSLGRVRITEEQLLILRNADGNLEKVIAAMSKQEEVQDIESSDDTSESSYGDDDLPF